MPTAKKKTATKQANIYAVIGNDEAQVKEAALKISKDLTPPDAGEFGTEIIDGIAENSDHAGKICADTIQALQTLPFFGGDKLVWLKNTNFAGDTVTGRAKGALEGLENLLDILKGGIPPDVKFLFSATDIDKRRSFYKGINKLANISVFDRPDVGRGGWEADVMSYVSKRARTMGLSFAPGALEHFVSVAGEDTRIVQNELEKLDIYLGDGNREARPEDVQAIVSLGRGGVVFEIGNAIGKRDLANALELVDHFLFRGESAVGILLAAIVPKVRNLLLARDLEERLGIRAGNYRSYESAVSRQPASATAHLPKKKDGAPSVYPLFLASGESRKFSLGQLKTALAACLEANHRLVQSALDPKLVLHQLLTKILAN